ncbi:autotransporter outer membrane beta-barrel domain-containing protein [Sphingopyxis sp. MWB1]|uniref:autotransporter outer membrane beta-barrel domain-containing protein n=1 Tax=Sphingopyxis sp. MWB1 TaxID=1537715 RepID=UPI00068E6DD4|nr:autotransporter outer membrane beta-barrel domain-containing protein [Sphingopyxis sp. MWB1]
MSYRYPLTVALLLSTSSVAFAEVVGDGSIRFLTPTTPHQTWSMSNGSRLLTREPGARTDWIDIDSGGEAQLDGVTVDTAREAGYAVGIYSGTGEIRNSTINNSKGGGVTAGRRAFSSDPRTSTLIVTDSVINSVNRGALVQGDSALTLSGTEVNTTGTTSSAPGGSAALHIGDGVMTLENGSYARGEGVGAWFAPDLRFSDDGIATGTLIVDASTVEGQNGAAVHIGGLPIPTKMSQVDVIVQNGGNLIGGNGIIMQVDYSNAANLTVDNSILTGDVVVLDDSTASVGLYNGSSLTGDLSNVETVTLSDSELTGDVWVEDGRASTINLVNSALTGNLTNVGTLTMDASTLTGDTLMAASGPGVVALANGSLMEGYLTDAADLSVDASTIRGDVVMSASSSNPVSFANGSALEGDLSGAQGLMVDASAINGNVTLAEGSAGAVSLTNGSSLIGSITGAGELTLENSTMTADVVIVDGGSGAVDLSNGSTLTGNIGGATTVTADASTISGDITLLDGGLSLTSSSALTGNVARVADLMVDDSMLTGNVTGLAGGSSRVALDNGATFVGTLTQGGSMTIDGDSLWRMTGNSSAGSLAISNGVVEVSGRSGAPFNTLTLGSLSGNGTFLMGTDLAAGTGDLIQVTGDASGDHLLLIQNSGAAPTTGEERVKVVATGGGSANFRMDRDYVELGAFEFALNQEGRDWYLSSKGLTPGATTVIGIASATPSIWYGEVSTLRARMGDLHLGDTAKSGIWGRTYSGKYSIESGAGRDYDQRQWGLTLGADVAVPTGSAGNLHLGLMGGYSNSNLDFHIAGAKGGVDSWYVGAYGTWLLDSGWYIDGLIKQNWFSNDASASMNDGTQTVGEFKSTGLGGQIEVGKRFSLANDKLIFEPFAQIASFRAGKKDWGLDNGMAVENRAMDSFVTRLGAHFGYNIQSPDGSTLQPYVKLAVANEFNNDNAVYVNDTRFNNDLSGARGEVGVGLAAQINEGLHIHGEFDYAKGKNYEQQMGISFGARFSF